MKIRILLSGAFLCAFSGAALAQGAEEMKGLPASDVLGSEDLWDNPTFVGGVIGGGPSATSQY